MSTVVRTLPVAIQASILAATTAAIGTNWTAFADTPTTALDLQNFTGTAIEYRRRGGGNAFQIANGGQRLILAISNANQIEVRRVDQSNTQVTVNAEALAAG